jgi:hypothetical protein
MPTPESQLKKGFASNLKGANKVIMLSSTIQDCEVGWIFSLDVQVCQKKQSEFKIKRESKTLHTGHPVGVMKRAKIIDNDTSVAIVFI